MLYIIHVIFRLFLQQLPLSWYFCGTLSIQQVPPKWMPECSWRLLPLANEVWGKVIFLHQFVILFTGGACMVAPGGACVVAPGGCVVLFGRACVVLFGGACMVLFGRRAWFYLGGHAWFYLGGMHGFIRGGHAWFFQFFRIQWDTVNEQAVRILLECILVFICVFAFYSISPKLKFLVLGTSAALDLSRKLPIPALQITIWGSIEPLLRFIWDKQTVLANATRRIITLQFTTCLYHYNNVPNFMLPLWPMSDKEMKMIDDLKLFHRNIKQSGLFCGLTAL